VAFFVFQEAFLGLRDSKLDDATFFDPRGAFFTKTTAALQNFASPTQSFISRIPTDAFHGGVPGRNAATGIHCKHAVGHGIDNLIDEPEVPYFMSFFRHDPATP
jgi:hypothetical protein